MASEERRDMSRDIFELRRIGGIEHVQRGHASVVDGVYILVFR